MRLAIFLAGALLWFCAGTTLAGTSTVGQIFDPPTALGTPVYIAPSGHGGSDSNPCTLGQPCLTLSHIQSVVRTLLSGGTNDIVVYLRGNTPANSHVSFTGSIAGNTLTVSSVSSGALMGGDVLIGKGLAVNTIVTGYGTGSGGVGTYTVSPRSQALSSEAITAYQPQIYAITSTLTLTGADSPPDQHRVTWSSAPGELAAISGGVALTGTFSLCTTADTICNSGANGVYQTTVTSPSDFREAYFGGIGGVRSQWPLNSNTVPSGWSVTSGGVYTAPSNATTPTSSWTNVGNIELMSQQGWQTTYCPILSISGTTVTMQTPCVTNWAHAFYPQSVLFGGIGVATPMRVVNAYELLTTCGGGCWYYNRITNALYYLPRAQENISTLEVIVPAVFQLVSCACSNLTFQELVFEHSTWTDPDNGGFGYVEMQSGYHCPLTPPANCRQDNGTVGDPLPAAMDFTSHGVFLKHNTFAHLSARPVLFEHEVQYSRIDSNLFFDNAGGSIQVGDITDYAEVNQSLWTTGNVIVNNEVNAPTEYYAAGGIFVPIASSTLISHNYIPNNSWAPIATGWWGWSTGSHATYNTNNLVSYNLITTACNSWPQEDCGAIYNNGAQQNFTVTTNYSFGVGGIGNFTTQEFQGCWYADNGSAFTLWTVNLCDGAANGTPNHWAFIGNGTNNNLFLSNYATTSAVADSGTSDVFSGNTLVSTGCGGNSGCLAIMNAAGPEPGVNPGP